MAEGIKERRERTRLEDKCQLCGVSVPLSQQYTVVNDLKAGKPVKRKNAARKGADTASHYCEECAERRIKQKQAWLTARAKRRSAVEAS